MKSLALSTFVAVTVASSAFAKTSDVAPGQFSVKALRSIAEETATVELPAAAVDVILDAPEADRERIAVRTVRIFLTSKHSLAPSLVGAIAANAPELAPAVVEAAIQLFPENAYAITRAAVSAAPEYSVAIALRAVKAFPEHAGRVVAGVQRGNPAGAETFGNFIQAIQSGGERVFSDDDAVVTFKYQIGSSDQATGSGTLIEIVVETETREVKNEDGTTKTDPVTGNPVTEEVVVSAEVKVPEEAIEQKVFEGVEAKTVEKEVTVVNADGTTETKTETVVVFEEKTKTVIDDATGLETEVPVTVEAPATLVGVEVTDVDSFDIISRVLDTASEFVAEVVVEEYVQ